MKSTIFFKPKNHGFTLVELLVVISIIGILSSILLVSYNSVRADARDAKRAASIKQVQTALEVYNTRNGRYPTDPSGGGATINAILTSFLVPAIMPEIPTDPSGTPYLWLGQDGSYYAIFINYETKSDCYVCAGSASCRDGQGWWGVQMCR